MFAHPVTFATVTDDDDFFAELANEESVLRRESTTRFDDDSINDWNPGERSPTPFNNARLGGRIVPRVPIRLAVGGSENPQKIDPRAVRQTEVIEQILNGLITSGGIYKTNDGWEISHVPRQVTDLVAFIGEIYFSTTRNRLCFKDADQYIRELY